MRIIPLFTVAVLASTLFACAGERGHPPSVIAHDPGTGSVAEPKPQIGRDYVIAVERPSELWIPLSPDALPGDADIGFLNIGTKSLVLMKGLPYELEGYSVDDSVRYACRSWADDPGATTEPLRGGTDARGRWAALKGTFIGQPSGSLMHRRFIIKQLSEELDAAVLVFGLWDDVHDAATVKEFAFIEKSVRTIRLPGPPPSAQDEPRSSGRIRLIDPNRPQDASAPLRSE